MIFISPVILTAIVLVLAFNYVLYDIESKNAWNKPAESFYYPVLFIPVGLFLFTLFKVGAINLTERW